MSQEPGSNFQSTGLDFVPTLHHDTYPAIDPKKADLSGKTVLITGASKGVGAATGISFARAGASGIILAARSSLARIEKDILAAAKEAGKPSPKVLSLNLDVSKSESVEAAAKEVAAKFDSVDVLINNAGYLERWEKIADSDPKTWWTTWETNVFGVYLMCRAFLPLVMKSSSKIIINLSSIGSHLANPGSSSYTTTKLAVNRFTEHLLAEYGQEGLLPIAVHPGGVNTELARNMPEAMHQVLIDEPALAADAFVWLTKTRPEWLAGRYFAVPWDVDELTAKKDEIVKGDLLKVRMAVGGLE